MATNRNSEILKEFLVALGFQVDVSASRKFYDALAQTSKGAAAASAALAGVAVAAEVMVNKLADSIESLYYQSKRTKSTVSELKALRYASEQVGVSADETSTAVERIGKALTGFGPGFLAVLQGLNIKTDGRSAVQVFKDLIPALAKLDPIAMAGWGSMFGMSTESLRNLAPLMQDFTAALGKQQAAYEATGIDQQAKTWRDYANEVKTVWENVSRLTYVLASDLLPAFQNLTQWINAEAIPATSAFIHEMGGLKPIVGYVKDVTSGFSSLFALLEKNTGLNPFQAWARGMQVVVDSIKMVGTLSALIGHGEFAEAARVAKNFTFGTDVVEATTSGNRKLDTPAAGGGTAGLFDRIEKAFHLPAGTMDRLWGAESSRGTNMGPSSAGALGHFQFMPSTAAQYGVNPFDLTSSAIGAGQYLSDLMGQHGGNLRTALAAYNGAKDPLHPSAGVQGYVNQVMGGGGVTLNSNTNINVSGSDPHSTAQAVAAAQSRVLGDAVRNLQGAVR
jgi:hypothetical protein